MNKEHGSLMLLMNSLNEFKTMINNLTEENLSELCEQFLFDHEGAMKTLSKYCKNSGLIFDNNEIKEHMISMHSTGDFDNVLCFGIELSENQLYKKFHPS